MVVDIPDILGQLIPLYQKQDELAEALDTDQPQISRWLKGQDPRGENRDRILTLARRHGLIADIAPSRKAAPPSRFSIVPLVSWVSAGMLTDSKGSSQIEKIGEIAVADLGSGDFFSLKVSGNSMDRLSPDGSIIVVNQAERIPQEGKPYVFAYRGETTYKIWRGHPPRLEPFSTDPSNQTHFIEKKYGLYVLGRVRRSILDL